MEKYEIIKFKDNEFEMDVNVSPNEDMVWLTIEQIALLFKEIDQLLVNISKKSMKKVS